MRSETALMQAAANWLVPPGLLSLLHRVRARGKLSSADRALFQANRALRDRHRGERVFILGCGPSIKLQDLKPLRGELCISVANFFVHPDHALIKPRYHCIAPLHPPFTGEDGIRWFKAMEPSLAGSELLLSMSDRSLVQQAGVFQAIPVHYLAFGHSSEWKSNNRGQLDRLLPGVSSVSIMALLVALYLGCREIYLLGTDHTSFNLSTGQYAYSHFYTGQARNSLGEQPPPADLESEFASNAALWRQYKLVREIARELNVSIQNASAGGLLDVFPRVELKELLSCAPVKPY